MSWDENLLDASFRGVPLDVMADRVDTPRAIASQGLPYSDGQDSEDMGRDARAISLRLAVFGPDYEARLQATVAALEQGGPGELMHPVYGNITALVARHTIDHEASTPDYAEIAVTFVEHEVGQPFFERAFDTVDGAIAGVGAGAVDWRRTVRNLLGRVDTLVADARGHLGGGWRGLVGEILAVPGAGARLAQMRVQADGVLAGMSGFTGRTGPGFDPFDSPDRLLDEVHKLCQALLPTQDEAGLDLQRFVAGEALMPSVPGHDALPGSVSRIWRSCLDAGRDGGTDEPLTGQDALTGDLPTRYAAGLLLLVHTTHALVVTQAVATVLDEQQKAATLTPADIDRIVQQSRGLLQGAIAIRRLVRPDSGVTRAIEPMKNAAAVILEAARQILMARPSLSQRVVPSATCTRALAHLWYGDHTRADELQHLNPTLRRPYAIPAGTVVNAYVR